MDWLRQNAFIATWLSPLVALVGMIIRGTGKSGEMDWPRVMLYVAFLTCLAATLTPSLDLYARGFAGMAIFGLIGFFRAISSPGETGR
jgi:hypothetical protein